MMFLEDVEGFFKSTFQNYMQKNFLKSRPQDRFYFNVQGIAVVAEDLAFPKGEVEKMKRKQDCNTFTAILSC